KVVSFTPSRRATDAHDVSAANAICTASRRNSSGYLDGLPIRDSLLRPQPKLGVHRSGARPHAEDTAISVPESAICVRCWSSGTCCWVSGSRDHLGGVGVGPAVCQLGSALSGGLVLCDDAGGDAPPFADRNAVVFSPCPDATAALTAGCTTAGPAARSPPGLA